MEMAESKVAAAESATSPGYGNTPHQSAHLHNENNDPQDAITSMQAQAAGAGLTRRANLLCQHDRHASSPLHRR